MDLETHEVSRAPAHLNLTRTEFALLECLVRAAGKVVTRQSLIDQVWGNDREVGDNNLDVFIRLPRTKVDGPGQHRLFRRSETWDIACGTSNNDDRLHSISI